MRRLQSAVEIAAEPAVVWDLISRFEQWPRWGLSVTDVESGHNHVDVGAVGRVKTPLGLWLPFRITNVEPGHSWQWRVAGVAATGHHVAQLGSGGTHVVFTVPWLAAPYLPVVMLSLRRLRRIAEAT